MAETGIPSSPLCAYIEYLIGFNTFRNVGLHGQGLYFIKANLYPAEPPEIFGLPLAKFNQDHRFLPSMGGGYSKQNKIKDAEIDEDDFSFTTRSFMIRYQQEEVMLFDSVTFTLKLPFNPLKLDSGDAVSTVILELDLYHTKASVLTASKQWLEKNNETQQPKRVSRVRLKIPNPLKGISIHYPVFFDERYFSRIDISFNSSLLYIFESNNYVSPDPPDFCQITNATTQFFFATQSSQIIYEACYNLLLRSYSHLVKRFGKLLQYFTPKEKEMLAEAATLSELKTTKLSDAIVTAAGSTPYNSILEIMANLYEIGSEISTLWVKFLSAVTINPGDSKASIKQTERKQIKIWMESVCYESFTPPSTDHSAIVAERRKSDYYINLKQLPLVEQYFAFNPDEWPIIFECNQGSKQSKPPRTRDSEPSVVIGRRRPTNTPNPHLIVLVHGLKGSSFDLRLYKHYIGNINEDCEFLSISSIENDTLNDIAELGKKVADEIIAYMRVSVVEYCKISFIGHSLGGLIIRAALMEPDLECLQKKFFTFLTLATPHLGSIFYSSTLIPSAMWFWEKWTAAICLKQLRLMDNGNPESCLLYKLAVDSKALSYFKNVLLVASEQDYYVPFASTRIELPMDVALSGKQGSVYAQMREALMKSMENVNLVKFDVQFGPSSINTTKFDTITGRGAHVAVLDDEIFVRMFVNIYQHYFV